MGFGQRLIPQPGNPCRAVAVSEHRQSVVDAGIDDGNRSAPACQRQIRMVCQTGNAGAVKAWQIHGRIAFGNGTVIGGGNGVRHQVGAGHVEYGVPVINDRDGMGYGRVGEPVGGVAVFYDKVCIIFILGRGKRWGVCEGRKCVWHGYFPDLYIFYKYMHSSFTSFTKPHLRCFPLLRSSFLLIRRRSLQRFSQTDFHANLKSACINLCVNCDV